MAFNSIRRRKTTMRAPMYMRIFPPGGITGILSGALQSKDIEVLNVTQVTLTAAQILAMFTTPVQVLPAPDAGFFWEIQKVIFNYSYGTAAYTSGGAIQLSYGAGVTTPATATVAATFLTSPSVSQAISVLGALASTAISALVATAVNVTNATQVFASGDGTLTITVHFRRLALA